MTTALPWALVLAAAVAFPTAGAATPPVYRCGSSYADQPCTAAKLVDVADDRSDAQQADARRIAAEERRRLAVATEERQRRERTSDRRNAARLDRPAPVLAATAPAVAVRKKRRPTGGALDARDFLAVDAGARPRGR